MTRSAGDTQGEPPVPSGRVAASAGSAPARQPGQVPGKDHSVSRPLTEDERVALSHAWEWFAIHSSQRMQLLSFFFVAVALLVAGYGAALQADEPVVALGLSGGGLLITLAFALADHRTKILVKASEEPIAELERRLASAISVTSLNLVDRVAIARPKWSSYTWVVRLLLTVTALLMAGGIVLGLHAL